MAAQVIDILLEKGVLTREQLSSVEKLRKGSNISIEDALKQLNIASTEDIVKCVAQYYGLDFVDINAMDISKDVLDMVPKRVATRHGIIPISKDGMRLTIAMSNPPDLPTLDNLRFILGVDIRCVLTTEEALNKAILKYYEQGVSIPSVDNLLSGLNIRDLESTDIQLVGEEFPPSDVAEDEAPIIRIVMRIISEAVKARASDIHIEPCVNRFRIRYRIDGVCHEVMELPKRVQGAIISRIKIMASIDITERRRPQDGRISLKINDKPLDLRVSTIPVTDGESIVMRLLEKESIMIGLDQMGFAEDDYKRFKSLIKRPNGIILITGPTGSGKTTTLYASINEINTPDKKIITVENPIEYNLKGINQCEVNEAAGLTFPVVLRSMLRQDPNIIIVGEIRDVETAEIAVAAALTGHLIFSTLHTNDATSAITRLADMGIKLFLISSSLQAVMAQRLARVICHKCKEPFNYSKKELLEVGLDPEEMAGITLYKGKGCDECKNTGYKGRMGIYELMVLNSELKEMIYRNESKDKIKDVASRHGMKTLREDGLRKAFAGLTTIDEVIRIAGA